MRAQVKAVHDFILSGGEDKETSIYVRTLEWYINKVTDALTGDQMSVYDLRLQEFPSIKIKA